MNAPLTRERGIGRPTSYRTMAGKRVPSVTTILGVLNKPALVGWAEKKGRESLEPELVRLRDGLYQAAGYWAAGSVEPSPGRLRDVWREVRRRPDYVGDDFEEHLATISREAGHLLAAPSAEGPSADEEKEAAAAIGSAVHDMIEEHAHDGDPTSVLLKRAPRRADGEIDTDFVATCERAFQGFCDWLSTQKLEIVATEVALVSEEHRFGGTLDAILKHPTRGYSLGDWKTSKRIYSEYICQLAAYGILWRERRDVELAEGAHVIRFGKNGNTEHRQFADLRSAAEQFLLLRKVYDGMKAVEALLHG